MGSSIVNFSPAPGVGPNMQPNVFNRRDTYSGLLIML